MTYAQRLQESGNTLFWYVRISGLPYVWPNVDLSGTGWEVTPGSRTVSIDSETYTLLPTFAPPDSWGQVRETAEPWLGIANASQLELPFLLPGYPADSLTEATDAWLGILAGSIRRGAVSVMTADAAVGAGSFTVDQTTAWAASGTGYAGLETFEYSAKGATSLTVSRRGAYGSWALYHVGDLDQVQETGRGGPYVADHPLALEGRVVWVWQGTGYEDLDGNLVPWGSTIESSEDKAVWAGVIRRAKPDKSQGLLKLKCESLRSLLSREVGKRLPRAKAGGGLVPTQFYVSDDNNLVSWSWIFGDASATASFVYNDVRLQRDDGGGTSEEVPAGWYSFAQLLEYVNWTLTSGETPTAGGTTVAHPGSSMHVGLELVADDDGNGRWRVRASTSDNTSSNGGYAFHVTGATRARHLWRELGFTGSDAYADAAAITGSGYQWPVSADRRAPVFFLPATHLTRQIQYHGASGPTLDASPGWTDDDGNAVEGHARIGDEVVSFSAVGTTNVGATVFSTLTISGRGRAGSEAAEIYVEGDIEGDVDIPEIVQGLVFPGTSWAKAGLYLATMMDGASGNGTHDVGWRGGGAAIPSTLIDAQSWLDVAAESDGKRDVARFEATRLDEILGPSLVLSQAVLGALSSSSGEAYQLTARNYRPPLQHEASSAVSLGTAELRTIGMEGIGWIVDEAGIVNTIVAENMGYDHGRDEAREKATWVDGTSAGTWPESRPLDVDMRDVEGRDEARRRLADLAQVLLAQYGAPFLVLELNLAQPKEAWTLELGDAVTITHPLVIKRASVGRGVTALVGRVYGIQRVYRNVSGRPRAAGTITVVAQEDGRRFAGYAPSAYCYNLPSTTRLRCRDYWDSYDQSGTKDVERFASPDGLRLYNPGNEAAAELRKVSSITLSGTLDQSEIVINSATALTPPIVVEPTDYDSVDTSETHRDYAYLSDGDGDLDRPSGDPDTAYEYA